MLSTEAIQNGAPTQAVATPAPEPGAESATTHHLTTLGWVITTISEAQYSILPIFHSPRNVRELTLRLRPALGAAVWTQGKMAQ